MNWLWVRAMRGRAYGSDEAENWPQRKTESEKDRKKERKKERERAERWRKKRKRGRWAEKQHPEIQASINGAEHACIFAANSECCINTGLVLGCPSRSVVCVWFIMGLAYIYQRVGAVYLWDFPLVFSLLQSRFTISTAHTYDYSSYWDIYGTACLSFLCHCLLSVKLCINACICHLTSYSVVQLHGLRLPSITGLYDRARPGTGNHPSWPQRVLHGRKRPASPSA